MLSLLSSRKFWLTIFTVVGLLVALLAKQINGTTFAEAATAAVMLLVAAIAHEDTAKKTAEAATDNTKTSAEALKAMTEAFTTKAPTDETASKAGVQ